MSQTNLLGPVYQENLNSIFHHLTEDSQRFDLELTEMSVLDSPPGQEQFSLIFRGPLDMPHVQKMYTLEHDKLGTSDIFLVPIGRDQQGIYFEAVFNRFLT